MEPRPGGNFGLAQFRRHLSAGGHFQSSGLLAGAPGIRCGVWRRVSHREDGKIIERYPTEPFDRKRLTETCYICQPTVFIRSAVLREIGFLDEGLRYCMDYDLWFRIARRYDLGYLPEYLACTRFYGETKTLGQKVQVHREILDMVYRHHGSVPASWVYGYGHALLERRISRATPWGNALFILGLIGVSLLKFLRYNRRVPLGRVAEMGGMVSRSFSVGKIAAERP